MKLLIERQIILFSLFFAVSLVSLPIDSVRCQVFTKVTPGDIATDIGRSVGAIWGLESTSDIPFLLVTNGGNLGPQNNYYYDITAPCTLCADPGIVTVGGRRSMSGTWGDIDNDGDLDLFVANENDGNNQLYRRNPNGTFLQVVTGEIVLDGGKSKGAAFADINQDGWLDLFVSNAGGQKNFVYINDGNAQATFTRDSDSDAAKSKGASRGCAFADYDNDGDQDLFVANYNQNDFLLENINGELTKVTSGVVVTTGGKSRGGSWGDYDNDGHLDQCCYLKNPLSLI